MNKLKTLATGGFPFVLDDLRFTHNAYEEAFKGILSAFGIAPTETFILSGCKRTVGGGVVSVTEGYISLQGEVLYMPPQSYPVTTDTEYLAVNIQYDPAGLKLFQDASTNDTYEVRQAQILVSATPPLEHVSIQAAQTIFEIIQNNLPGKVNVFESIGPILPIPLYHEWGDIMIHNSTTVYVNTPIGWVSLM